MAQSLPHQGRRLTWCRAAGVALAAGALLTLMWVSCGDEPATEGPESQHPDQQHPDQQGATTDGPPRPQQSPRSPEQVIEALLDRHHGPVKGTLDRAVLELRTEPKAAPLQALVALPHKMRLDRPDGSTDLLVEGVGWHCVAGQPAHQLEGPALRELGEMRHYLSAILLDPLYRAKKVKRAGAGVYSLILPGGETWRLEIVEPSLELVELRGPAGPVRFVEFLETGVTVLPKKVELPKLGVRWVEFLANDLVVLNPTLFMDPALKLANNPGRMRTRQTRALPENPDERPAEPVLQDIESRMFLVNPDPGTWTGRRDLLMREGNRLDAKGQVPNGLPTYREADTGIQLLIPFRPDPSRGYRPYVREPDDEIWHMPQHRAVVVAPIGTWDDVVARGREKIAAYLEANDLEADGAMLCMPFVHAEEIPDEDQRKELTLRLEQGVRARH